MINRISQSTFCRATEIGYGGCCIASIQKDKLHSALKLPAEYEILLVLALGKPVEKVVLEPLPATGKIEYWRDDSGTHHVPKRSLTDIIIK